MLARFWNPKWDHVGGAFDQKSTPTTAKTRLEPTKTPKIDLSMYHQDPSSKNEDEKKAEGLQCIISNQKQKHIRFLIHILKDGGLNLVCHNLKSME